MRRMIRYATAAMMIVVAGQSASANDFRTCSKAAGEAAINACSRVLLFNWRDSNAHNNRGLAYIEKGDFRRAIIDFNQAIGLNPESSTLYVNRGYAYINENDYGRAIADFDQAIRLDPKNADAYIKRGKAYDDNDEYDRAIADFDQAIHLDPKNVGTYIKRGITFNNKGEYDHAIADFDEAVHLDPTSADAHVKRGGAYDDKGDYDHAVADLDEAIRLDPKNAITYSNRGVAYDHKGEYDHAVADLTEALSLDPENAITYGNRGLIYDHKGEYDRAITDLTHALSLAPKDAITYSSRGLAYDHKGEYGPAIADLTLAITLDPKLAVAYNNRGYTYNNNSQYDLAITDLTQAIALDPKLAVAYNNRGNAYKSKGDYEHAAADYDEALKLDPSLTNTRQERERLQTLLAKQQPGPVAPATANAVAPPAPALGRRVALVIGMSTYAHVERLRNPVRDARAIADVFRRLGFTEVIEREDLTRTKLEETLKEFGDKATDADWAVVYYAGHGIEMNGSNYLVPIDAELTRADHVEDETVPLWRVLSKTQMAHKLRMIILDACRNNPFQMASADGRPRGISRGLSPIEPEGGVLVAYAARGGTTANDGDSEHSPFTQALLSNLETPGLEISLLFRRVRDQVLARTNRAQEPFTYGSLPGDEFYFKQAAR